MEEKTTDTKKLQIVKDQIVPLIAQLSLVENDLSGLFDIPQASEPSAKAAGEWWEAQTEEDQYTYRGALAAIAAPMLIADIGINAWNEKLIITHAVLPSLRWNDPIYLLGQDSDKAKFRLEYLKQADLFTNTLLLYLQGAAPVYEMEMKFEVSVRDFAVLLATADLRQRQQYRALLDHAPFPPSVKADDVMVSVTEGFVYPDPRWLLPFCLPVLHIGPSAISKESTRQSLDNLVKTGLIKKDRDEISLKEPGERFCESVAGRTSCIRIDTWGVDEKGRRGRQSVLFIRGEHFLWYAGTSGRKADTMVVTTIGLDQAEALLRELFTPLAAPKPGEPVRPAPAVIQAPAPAAAPPSPAYQSPPPLPPQPAVPMPAPVGPAAPAAGGLVCKACGNPIKPGDKFCSKCLVKVPAIMTPESVQAAAPVPAAPPAPAYQSPPPPTQSAIQAPAPVTPAAAPAAGGLLCKACRNPIRPGDKFCSKCLVKVPDTPVPAAAPAVAPPPPPPPPSQSAIPAPAPVTPAAAPAAGGLLCKACGSPVKPGLKFCSNCGAKIE
jgi:predicted nucleic acid-binding Zn ribbon protein